MTAGSARWIAAVRAQESERPDRLFDDPYARLLAGDAGFATMARSERATGGENPYIPVRVRWFDDAIIAAVTDGVDQVVVLGAGLDTRPYRLSPMERSPVDWYEVDRAPTFVHKEPLLAQATPNCHRRTVAADLTGAWPCALRDAGFDPTARTLWVAEGLFFYLAESVIAAVLRQAAALSGPGSRLLADVIGTSGAETPGMRAYRDWCAGQGLPPPYASPDPRPLLAAGGWRATHLTTPGAPDANYGRLKPIAGWAPGLVHLLVAEPQEVS